MNHHWGGGLVILLAVAGILAWPKVSSALNWKPSNEVVDTPLRDWEESDESGEDLR